MSANSAQVHFTTVGELKANDIFVVDLDDVTETNEYLKFLSLAYDGAAMVAAANTNFVRGFKTGLTSDTLVIQILSTN
jgi:hypothetical protein